jgi:hypothetical protein
VNVVCQFVGTEPFVLAQRRKRDQAVDEQLCTAPVFLIKEEKFPLTPGP